MSAIYDAVRDSALQLEEKLIGLRRYFHEHPELSWNEVNTSRKIRELLTEAGLTPSKSLATNGLYVDIKGSEDGPLIAFRADMDALPITDLKKTSYCSKNEGVGHMCGHDFHTATAYGIAMTLNQHRNQFKGTVRVFWQPAEESTPSGAPDMIKDGILLNVSAVYAVHCDPTLPSGSYGLKPGPETASYDAFEIDVLAESPSHSARPHTGKDTMWIANQFIQNLYQLSTRLNDSRSPVVIAVCRFQAGNALNVIPEKVHFGGTIRTSDEASRVRIKEHIRSLSASFELLYGVKIQINLLGGAPPVENDPRLYDFAKKVVSDVAGPQSVNLHEQSMGGEDFGYYSQLVPSFFMRIGSSNSPETSYALHTNHFDIDESVIAPTVALQSYLLMTHLNNHGTIL